MIVEDVPGLITSAHSPEDVLLVKLPVRYQSLTQSNLDGDFFFKSILT